MRRGWNQLAAMLAGYALAQTIPKPEALPSMP
jgi:hypothetical protein